MEEKTVKADTYHYEEGWCISAFCCTTNRKRHPESNRVPFFIFQIKLIRPDDVQMVHSFNALNASSASE